MSVIKDSGDRTRFETGAVRDLQGEDKGWFHLVPLDIVAELFGDDNIRGVLKNIQKFVDTGDADYLKIALVYFAEYEETTIPKLMLEVSVHYRNGAEKYQPHNWKRGIPISSFVSSSVRHLLKRIDHQNDERHDRAFVWNVLGAWWTMENKPEMDDLDQFREPTKMVEHIVEVNKKRGSEDDARW